MEASGTTNRRLAALAPRVTRAWYVVARSADVGATPVTTRLFGQPIVVFRGASGRAVVFVDRCPHRTVPLSRGAVEGDTLRCGYHGWRFAEDGGCVEVPGLDGPAAHPARRAVALPVVEQQGFVWAWAEPGGEPDGLPFRFRYADDPSYTTVRKTLPSPGSVQMVIENALDVPHTAFLHGGLFRKSDTSRRPVKCVIRRFADRAECEFVGEAAPQGIAARILSPSGGEVSHVDRFYLPSITEVEYRIGTENHLVLNGAVTPLDDFESVVHAVVSFRMRLPGWVVRPLVEPIALRIFGQDVAILDLQVKTMQAFGEVSYVNTDIDVLGGHILRLLQRAARQEVDRDGDEAVVRETTMWI